MKYRNIIRTHKDAENWLRKNDIKTTMGWDADHDQYIETMRPSSKFRSYHNVVDLVRQIILYRNLDQEYAFRNDLIKILKAHNLSFGIKIEIVADFLVSQLDVLANLLAEQEDF